MWYCFAAPSGAMSCIDCNTYQRFPIIICWVAACMRKMSVAWSTNGIIMNRLIISL